jgi:hypothetical protein
MRQEKEKEAYLSNIHSVNLEIRIGVYLGRREDLFDSKWSNGI